MLETGDDPDKHSSREQERPSRHEREQQEREEVQRIEFPGWWEELQKERQAAGLSKMADLVPVIAHDLKKPEEEIPFRKLSDVTAYIDTWLGLSEVHTIKVLVSRAVDHKNA